MASDFHPKKKKKKVGSSSGIILSKQKLGVGLLPIKPLLDPTKVRFSTTSRFDELNQFGIIIFLICNVKFIQIIRKNQPSVYSWGP